MDSVKTSADFSFVFEGSEKIEAALLGLSLTSLTSVINEIVKHDDPKAEYKLCVASTQKGSFVVDLSLVLVAVTHIAPLVQTASQAVSAIKGGFDIKKALKGENPVSVKEHIDDGTIEVTDPYGSVVKAPIGSIITIRNEKASNDLSNIARAAHLHNPDGGFKLIANGEETKYGKEDVLWISHHYSGIPSPGSENSNVSRVMLPISSLNLRGNASWRFLYAGRQITARIMDATFLQSVHSGMNAFKAGDMLDVDLEIDVKAAGDGKVTGEVYKILKVHQIAQQTATGFPIL